MNDGPSCASNVKGVTHLLDAQGKEIESQAWSMAGRVPPDVEMSYNACCFSSSAKDRYASFRADITFTSIECI